MALLVAPACAPRETPPGETTFAIELSLMGWGRGSVASEPAGIDCAPTCTARFPAGTEVKLQATAEAGSVLTAWGVNVRRGVEVRAPPDRRRLPFLLSLAGYRRRSAGRAARPRCGIRDPGAGRGRRPRRLRRLLGAAQWRLGPRRHHVLVNAALTPAAARGPWPGARGSPRWALAKRAAPVRARALEAAMRTSHTHLKVDYPGIRAIL